MTYHNAVKYISEASDAKSINNSHDRLSYVCALLGNPQKKLNYIRLAGSNGKTICSALLSSVLYKSGYEVCTLTVSELDDVRENIRHNTHTIDMVDFTDAVQSVANACNVAMQNISQAKELLEKDGSLPGEYSNIPQTLLEDDNATSLSRSELLLLTALYFYKKSNCDICIIESSHNSFDPTLFLKPPFAAVICGAIPSDDKKQMLKIRTYIQRGISEVVSAPQHAHAYKMISDTCAAASCRLSVPVRSALTIKQLSLMGTSFVYSGESYRLGLCGRFQATNAITVIETLKVLRRCGYNISSENEKSGISSVKIKSRFEVLSVNPTIIADSTYKEEAIETICESLFDFSEITGRIANLCLPCEEGIVQKYLKMLSERGYTISDIYTVSSDDKAIQTIRSILPENTALSCFPTPKSAAKRIIASISADTLLFISGRHSFSSALRREIMNQMDF